MPKPMPRLPPVMSATRFELEDMRLSTLGWWAEEGVVGPILREPSDVQGKLSYMIVAPHAGFSARHFAAGRYIIPAVGPMVHGVEQQAFVMRLLRQIGLVEQRTNCCKSRFNVADAGVCFAFDVHEVMSQPQQTLR